MTVLHELGVKLRNQGKDGVHVLDSVVKGHKSFPVLDVLVLRVLRIGLLSLHILDQLHEVFSINLVPEGRLPCLELQINQRYEIPHVLE